MEGQGPYGRARLLTCPSLGQIGSLGSAGAQPSRTMTYAWLGRSLALPDWRHGFALDRSEH